MRIKSTVIIIICVFQSLVLLTERGKAAEDVQPTSILALLCMGKVSESSVSSVCMMGEKTVALSTDDGVSIWMLENDPSKSICQARASVLDVLDVHYLPEQETLILAASHVSAWHVGQNEIDVLGSRIADDEHFPDSIERFPEITFSENNEYFVASTGSVEGIPVIGRVDDLNGASAQTIPSVSGEVAWKNDGRQLFLTEWQDRDSECEAIVLRPVRGLKLGEPLAKFRRTLNDRTTEVTSDQEAQQSVIDPPIRTRIYDSFGIKTAFDSNRVFLSLYTLAEKMVGNRSRDVGTHEIWDVTDKDKCELVRIFSEPDDELDGNWGYFLKCLTVNAKEHQSSSAHFIFVYERGLIDIVAAPGPLVQGLESSAFVPLPEIASMPEQVSLVSAACISSDGRRIATGHESGHVIIWTYSGISKDP